MTPLPLLKFLKDNWVYIVIGLAIAAAIAGAVSWYNTQLEKAYDRGYSVGVADQYKEDKAKFDKMQEEHDRRVKELEKRSTELGEELDTLKQDSNAKISANASSVMVMRFIVLSPCQCISPVEYEFHTELKSGPR
jgi:hypothetical protein